MKAKELYAEYRKLEDSVAERFSELIKTKKVFNLLPNFSEEQDLHERCELVELHLTLIEVRNSFTGEVDDYYFRGADENGVYLLDKESFDEVTIDFDNISDLYSQIVFVELMEEKL